jgi:transcriptional regulator with XRE-family HTH domain
MSLVESGKPLSAREFRFLRKQMDLTQEYLAERLRVDAQTVARYEKDQTTIPAPTDFVVRILYAFHVCPKERRPELFEKMMELLEDAQSQKASGIDRKFSFTSKGWQEGLATRH